MYFFVVINKSYPWERIWSHSLSFKDAPVYKQLGMLFWNADLYLLILMRTAVWKLWDTCPLILLDFGSDFCSLSWVNRSMNCWYSSLRLSLQAFSCLQLYFRIVRIENTLLICWYETDTVLLRTEFSRVTYYYCQIRQLQSKCCTETSQIMHLAHSKFSLLSKGISGWAVWVSSASSWCSDASCQEAFSSAILFSGQNSVIHSWFLNEIFETCTIWCK